MPRMSAVLADFKRLAFEMLEEKLVGILEGSKILNFHA